MPLRPWVLSLIYDLIFNSFIDEFFSSGHNPDSDDKKMTADQINENIEKVLEITMPKHTKLLYGTEEGKRVERDPSAQEVRLI